MSKNLDFALKYAERGWHVHPVHYIKEGKCSCNGYTKGCKPGKHPKTKWKEWNTTDKTKITNYWTKYPDCNIGISTGTISGLIVIDIDPGSGGNTSLQNAIDSYDLEKDLNTYTVTTGSGGTHYYYLYDKKIKNYAGTTALGDGIDIRGENGYVVAPPSNHKSGGVYSIKNRVEPIQLPDKLLQLITLKLPQKADIVEGKRHTTLAEKAGQLLRNKTKTGDLLRLLSDINQCDCKPPLEFDEVEEIANHFIQTYKQSNNEVSFKTRWQDAIIDIDLEKRVKPAVIAVCHVLSIYMDTDGKCYPSQDTIAERIGMTRQTVAKHLDRAIEKGYLKSYRIGRKNTGGFHYGYAAMLPKKIISC